MFLLEKVKRYERELEELGAEKDRLDEEFEHEAMQEGYAREFGLKMPEAHIDDAWRLKKIRVDRKYEDTASFLEDARNELKGEMFEWVLGQTEDPEPEIGYQTPELYHAVAEKAYELADTQEDEEADVLREYADEWAEVTDRDVYGY